MSYPVMNPSQSQLEPGTDVKIEVNIKGKWVSVPALNVNGQLVVADGKWLKIGRLLDEEWLKVEIEDPNLCVKRLKESAPNRLKVDIFTFSQKPSTTQRKYTYSMEWDSVAAIHLTNFGQWWEQLPQVTRKNVRRSQKRGVTVQKRQFDDMLVADIKAVNDDCLVRQGRPNLHYSKSLDETRRDYSSFEDRCDFVCANIGKEVIGFLKLVYRGEVASILNLTTKPSHTDERPANALLAKAVELCDSKGISYITYGMFNYGNKRDSSLREFKIRNGFAEVLVPRYYVPLTAKGSLCLRFGLHRGLIGILPSGFIAVALNLRTKWHNLRGLRAGVAQ